MRKFRLQIKLEEFATAAMGKDFYKILGIGRGASDDEVKKAYRRLALRFHPDKNKHSQAEERFKEVAEAYEVLSDKKKRDLYDKYGEEGLRHGCSDHHSHHSGGQSSGGSGLGSGQGSYSYQFHGDPRATFAQFFGSSDPFTMFFDEMEHFFMPDEDFALGRGHGGSGRMQQDPPIEHELHIGLEDIANGCTKRMKISRLSISPSGVARKEDKVLNIDVRPGWKSGTKITFRKEGDQLPNRVPADIVFIIRDKPHPVFRRDGSDLHYTAQISLKQALCGVQLQVPTLQGEPLGFNTQGEIIKPNSTRRFLGKGLPCPKEPSRRGAIVLSFSIKFPESLSKALTASLASMLPN